MIIVDFSEDQASFWADYILQVTYDLEELNKINKLINIGHNISNGLTNDMFLWKPPRLNIFNELFSLD